ncbi:MAG: Integration host factor beta subunit, partial [uncultured Gemmatimonadaceae bacterium]
GAQPAHWVAGRGLGAARPGVQAVQGAPGDGRERRHLRDPRRGRVGTFGGV